MTTRTGVTAPDAVLGTVYRRDESMIPDSWFIAILIASTATVAGLMLHNRMVIQPWNRAFVMLAAALSLLAACRFGMRGMETRAKARLRDFSEYCLLFMSVSLLGVISTYPLAAVTHGFHDASLARMDALLHFDWVGWYGFVARHPALEQLGAAAYSTIYLSPAIILGHMAWYGQRAAARQFLVTFWVAAIITLLLFPLFPAKGPLAVLWNGPIPYMPTSSLYQAELIPELRAHSFTEIDLGALRGLVCAPSFHTVCGVLYMAAAWPIARLRWPLVALNGAMLLSTPVEGNHYLTDMLFGLCVAVVAIALVRKGVRMLGVDPVERAALGAPVRTG